MNKTITIQGPNGLKDTLKDIRSTKTSSNDRQEEEWLEYVAESIEKPTDHRLDLSCSAFNANKTGSLTTNSDTTAMMLMFREDFKSPATIKHSMDMIWKAVNHCSKVQPIIVALDQPLYAIVKRI